MFGVVGDIFIIYFWLKNLLAYNSILIKNDFKYANKIKIIIIEKFFI